MQCNVTHVTDILRILKTFLVMVEYEDVSKYFCNIFSKMMAVNQLEMFYLNSTFLGIPPVLGFQLEVYYKVERP